MFVSSTLSSTVARFLQLESKYTADDERKALEWITQVTGIQVNDLWEDLKNGAVLCALLNEIWPGVVPNYVKNPTHVLEERVRLNLSV